MKKAVRLVVLIIMVLALVKLNSSVSALDNEITRGTIRGLRGVFVLIEPLDPEIERLGLTKDQLKTDTELKLRLTGIKVLSEEEVPRTPVCLGCTSTFMSSRANAVLISSSVSVVASNFSKMFLWLELPILKRLPLPGRSVRLV